MSPSDIIVKAFDGSRKSIIGEVDLPIHIGPHVFQITFQVMQKQLGNRRSIRLPDPSLII